jgi:hypothetical protein
MAGRAGTGEPRNVRGQRDDNPEAVVTARPQAVGIDFEIVCHI